MRRNKQGNVVAGEIQVKDRRYVPVVNRRTLYAQLAKYTPKAIRTAVKLMNSPNHNVRLGAARLIMAKTMPDLQSMEVEGEIRQRVTVNVIKSYLQDFADSELVEASSASHNKVKMLNKSKTKAKRKYKSKAKAKVKKA